MGVRERFGQEHPTIRGVRKEALLEALTLGVDDNQRLDQIAKAAEEKLTIEVGYETEQRFDRFLEALDFVAESREASEREDNEEGTDRWVRFENEIGLPPLRVQIKSSSWGVKKFKDGEHFKRFKGKMIVISCGGKTSQEKFKRAFIKEMERVRNLL